MFNVGDNITTYSQTQKKVVTFKVLGILPKDYQMLNNLKLDNKLVNTNNYIILPIIDLNKLNTSSSTATYEDFGMNAFYLFNNSYFLFKNSDSNTQIKSTLDNINNNLQSLSIGKQKIESADKILNRDIDFLYANRDSAVKTGILIIFFLFLGVITSSIYIINKSKKQFGVYLMSGARIKDIALMVVVKNAIIFSVSMLVSTLYIQFIYNQFNGINLVTLLETFSIIFFICLLTLIAPVIKIYKLNICSLIKEEE